MSGAYLTAARLNELDAQLVDRDRAVLKRVSELRFVTGGQLRRLHFDGVPTRTVRAALLRLTTLGLLERLPRPVGGVRAGSSGFVYRLGLAGQRLSYGRTAGGKSRVIPGTLFVAHALQVAELHTLVVEADRAGRVELIELSGEAASRRNYGGPLGPRILKPDSYVRLGAGEYEDSYFIEVDRGTEGSRALSAKLRQYVEYEVSGREQAERRVFPLCLWLTPDANRAEVIADCIGRLPPLARRLFRVAPFGDAEALMADPGAGEGLPGHEKI